MASCGQRNFFLRKCNFVSAVWCTGGVSSRQCRCIRFWRLWSGVLWVESIIIVPVDALSVQLYKEIPLLYVIQVNGCTSWDVQMQWSSCFDAFLIGFNFNMTTLSSVKIYLFDAFLFNGYNCNVKPLPSVKPDLRCHSLFFFLCGVIDRHFSSSCNLVTMYRFFFRTIITLYYKNITVYSQ